jgi:hypothetical protein
MAYTMTEKALMSRQRGADANRRRKRIFRRTSASIDKVVAEEAKHHYGSVQNALEFAVGIAHARARSEGGVK